MAVDTYAQLWQRVQAFCPAAGPLLSQRWVVDSFRRIAERRRWSWLVKYGQFILPAKYSTGTVDVTQGSTTVTGTGTAWDVSMVGRQFRIGTSTPIYTIQQVNSATSLDLQFVWGGATTTGVGYEIYQCYVTPPDDFHALISCWDPNYNWQLLLNTSQSELNTWDAQRANRGQAYLLASYDYTQNAVGTVNQPLQIIGSGPDPAVPSGVAYSGPANAIFTIQITTGGVSGTAEFQWSKDGGTFTTGVVTDAAGLPQTLSDGVQIYFPLSQTYVNGNTWIIRTYVSNAVGLPRYELWPHNTANYVYPFLYEARAMDLDEPGAVLPRYIRGDVITDMATAMAARWPGPSVDQPNPMYDLNLAILIEKRCEQMIGELERQDDETYETMVNYATNLPWAPFADARFIQSHAF